MLLLSRFLALLILALLISGCSFRPLNLQSQSESLDTNVYINKIPNRRGTLLRQELIQKLGKNSENLKSSRYHLNIIYEESGRSVLITPENTEGRSEAQASAQFQLYDTELQKVVLSSKAVVSSAYSIGNQVAFSAYSSQVSEQGVRERLLPLLSEEITIQIHAFLKHKS